MSLYTVHECVNFSDNQRPHSSDWVLSGQLTCCLFLSWRGGHVRANVLCLWRGKPHRQMGFRIAKWPSRYKGQWYDVGAIRLFASRAVWPLAQSGRVARSRAAARPLPDIVHTAQAGQHNAIAPWLRRVCSGTSRGPFVDCFHCFPSRFQAPQPTSGLDSARTWQYLSTRTTLLLTP